MKKSLFLCGLFAAMLTACSDQEDLDKALSEIHIPENPYAIPVESALANLQAFLNDSEIGGSRATDDIVSVHTIKYNRVASRAEQDSLKCDNLLYVANFSDDKGYAILAADQRISEHIICIADSGSLTADLVYSALEDEPTRPIYKDYPLTGPGYFTTPETGDEIFMNPNTVSLYDAEHDDYFIGNFEEDEEDDVTDRDGQQIPQISPVEPRRGELTPIELTTDYAKRQIADYGRRNYTRFTPDVSFGSNDNEIHTEIEYGDWEETNKVSPLLWKYWSWDQDDPFNDLYPDVRHFPLIWKKKKAAAGCFPIAIAKVLTFLRFPSRITIQGVGINWSTLENKKNDWRKSAAHLLKWISTECDCWFFYSGTFTWPHKARKFLSSLGLPADIKDYDFDIVASMLDNSKPVIIYGIPGWRVTSCHSWNIDGYKVRTKTTTITNYHNDSIVSTSSNIEEYKMVHCCFNWRGNYDGYYVSGIFDMDDERVEFDSTLNKGEKSHYTWLLRILTY